MCKTISIQCKYQEQGQKPFSNTLSGASLVKSCRIHVSGKPFTCGDADMDFLASSGPQQQQDTHKVKEPNKGTQWEAAIQSRKSHYTLGEGKKACNSQHVLVDQAVHTGRQCFVCSECGKTFRYKSSFITHCRGYTGESFHVCGESVKSFSETLTFHRHQKIHT